MTISHVQVINFIKSQNTNYSAVGSICCYTVLTVQVGINCSCKTVVKDDPLKFIINLPSRQKQLEVSQKQ